MQISASAPGFIPHPNSLVECPVIDQQPSLVESLRRAAETIAPDMSHTESLPAAEPALTCTPPPLPAPIVKLNSRTIMLNGIKIRVDPKEIPITPLAMKFSNDLNGLFREWHSSTLLKIAGHGIPLKLWPEVYKLAGQAHWSSWQQTHKVLWSNFKVCLINDTLFASAQVMEILSSSSLKNATNIDQMRNSGKFGAATIPESEWASKPYLTSFRSAEG